MNVYTPTRFDERVRHLAVGVEPRCAISGQRLDHGVDVRWEEFPKPVASWRTWQPGETLTSALPALRRHRGGRFARTYDDGAPVRVKDGVVVPMKVRIVDDVEHGSIRIPGAGRRIVPRRIQLDLAEEKVVLAAEAASKADPAQRPHPVWKRTFSVQCYPGAGADLSGGATVLRGTVVATVGAALVPVRWTRVRATTPAGVELGWAHGDDRGEFVLVVHPRDTDVTVPLDPVRVRVTIGAVLPAPVVADPLLAVIDPLWDLPIEAVVASQTPLEEPTLSGRAFLPTQTQFTPITPVGSVELRHGRETSVIFRIT